MKLPTRVALTFGGLLALTILGAWLLAAGLFLRPLLAALVVERADTALYLAQELEKASDPRDRARQLSEELGVEIQPWSGEGHSPRGARRMMRRNRALWLDQDQRTTLYVPLEDTTGVRGMVVTFPSDIARPLRRVGLSFLILGAVSILGALLLTRWVLAPLTVAASAMDRIAAGDLSHRVQEGRDVAGRMGATFNRMAGRVEGLVAGRRRLLAAVSHELRTPLSRMRLQLDLLRDAGAPEDRIGSLEQDVREVDDLVGEILESSRLEEGVVVLHPEALLLREAVTEALATVDVGERTVDLSGLLDAPVGADRTRLVRVFTNLLSNAARYTPPAATVRMSSCALPGDRVRIRVEDDGPGVPPEALPHLFDPFFRAEESRSRRTGGLGLGLMLVRQIVEAHGGRISAENLTPHGLAVTMDLPAAPAADLR